MLELAAMLELAVMSPPAPVAAELLMIDELAVSALDEVEPSPPVPVEDEDGAPPAPLADEVDAASPGVKQTLESHETAASTQLPFAQVLSAPHSTPTQSVSSTIGNLSRFDSMNETRRRATMQGQAASTSARRRPSSEGRTS
jgi:hypothetical protein